MKTRILLCAVLAAAFFFVAAPPLSQGNAALAAADEVTPDLVKKKLETYAKGTAESAAAFRYLYDNQDRTVPVLYALLKKQDDSDRIVTLAALGQITYETGQRQAKVQDRQGNVLVRLTEYGLKPAHFYTAVILSVALFVAIVDLVRRKLLRIEYSWLWMLTGAAILVLISTGLVELIADLVGARVPQALFFAGVIFLTLISLHYSVTISKLTNQIKNLSQELAVLKHETEEQQPGGE
ncbi:MAG: DUF2304 domain-containing protein [Planctomycetota bacterium]